ncbi:MAG: DUF814 domain-containing protein [Polyangiaceae bacterium]|nr:DUF814 domain-containing protein [Polyangiaceae bacterium]
MSSKGRPFRTVDVGGFKVLIGRGEDDNDELTFNIAKPHDLWLHVGGGTPGSHVVIQNPDQVEVPREVIEKAAAYAAWFSKARNAARVEVHVCRASNVQKPRGAPAGLVHITRERRLKVQPEKPGADE